jgi:NAD(P)-dependent dehydrogenase (short-subunit alcohol dehydrogenase family)
MAGRLEGKVAVITGGCSGIGLETAEVFVAEGARVVVADIMTDAGTALEARFRGRLRFHHCDVTREDDVASAIRLAVEAFGGLDITFNNAGAVCTTETVETMQVENWDRAMNLLLRSVLFGIKHSAAAMKVRGGGSIVNASSISGVTTSGPLGYCVAKAAIIQLSRVAALQLAPHRIRVNSLLPGLIPTPIFGPVFGMSHETAKRMVPTLSAGASHLQPLPRAGNTRDIAEACLFLSTDSAAFVTGTELRIDGGMTLMAQMGMENTQPGSVGSLIAAAAHQAAKWAAV